MIDGLSQFMIYEGVNSINQYDMDSNVDFYLIL